MLEQLNARIAQLNDLLSLEKLGKISLSDEVGQLRAGLVSAEAERDRVKGLYDGLAGAGNDAAGRNSRTEQGAGFRKADFGPRAGAGRGADTTDQRAAPATGGAGERARCLREKGQGVAEPHRRSRTAAERRAGEAGAGTVALPFGILRTPADHSRQPAGYSNCRRPFRVPVGSLLRYRDRRRCCRKENPNSTRWPAR